MKIEDNKEMVVKFNGRQESKKGTKEKRHERDNTKEIMIECMFRSHSMDMEYKNSLLQ